MPWEHGVADSSKIHIDALRFTFQQAEVKLKEILYTTDDLVKRFTQLSIFLVATVTALAGYTFSTYLTNSLLFPAGAITLTYSLIVLVIAASNLTFKQYHTLGSEPALLFHPAFFEETIPITDQVKNMYLSELENYQRRITLNREKNVARARRYKLCLIMSLSIPGVMIMAYLLCPLFQ